MNLKAVLILITCLATPIFIGGVSGYLTSGEIPGWYFNLQKPSFNPPNYLFGPVWTLLYLLIGISLYMIWSSPQSKERKSALQIFVIQLFLNFCWSLLFFSFHLLFVSAVEILILWLSILQMLRIFRKVNLVAFYINIPYLLWVSFATLLNISIWYLN